MYSFINIPLKEPLLVFAVIISIVLAAPLFLKRINIPDIIGLIIAGVFIGPHGFNVLSEDISISIFGTIGLLYLMFLAGLEIDLNDFFIQRREGTLYGILTFAIPFIPGFLVFHLYLGYRVETALLLASMLASHTLVTYPILGRADIINHNIVTITIAGTIIADTAVLIILGLISDSVQSDLSLIFWIKTLFFFSIFFLYILYVIPAIARWVFKYRESESSIQFIFVLAVIVISSVVAEFLKIEPLIGAFFTGLSLNRLIPRTSALMNRVVFIGNTLFIPFFLITIGMRVDLKILFSGSQTWLIISMLLLIGIGGKYLAAWLLQWIIEFDNASRNLIFGLSTARAASAIAVMIVGQEFGLVDDVLLNSTIFIILVTCLVSSIVTQKSAQVVAGRNNKEFNQISSGKPEKIMVSIGNPDSIEQLIDFSILIKNPKSEEPLYPVSVATDGKLASIENEKNKKLLKKALRHASASDKKTELITRIDVNVVDGLVRIAKELTITTILIGWHRKTTPIDILFGSILSRLINQTNKMTLVAKLENPIGLLGKIHVFMPDRIEEEKGFPKLIETLYILSKHTGRKAHIYGGVKSLTSFSTIAEKHNFKTEFTEVELSDFFFKRVGSNLLPPEDLLIFIKARKNTISHNKLIERYPKIIQQYFCFHNVVIIYPKQKVFKKGLFHLYYMNN